MFTGHGGPADMNVYWSVAIFTSEWEVLYMYIGLCLPSQHETLVQSYFIVGPPPETLAQHLASIASMSNFVSSQSRRFVYVSFKQMSINIEINL